MAFIGIPVPQLTKLVEDPHITLVFFDPTTTTDQLIKAVEVTRPLFDRVKLIPLAIRQVSYFAPNKDNRPGLWPIIAKVTSHELNDLRASIVGELERVGIPYSKKYTFCPHITLGYVKQQPKAKLLERALKWNANTVALWADQGVVCQWNLSKRIAHNTSKCMTRGCDDSPTIEVIWADGRGHAWFCGEHFQSWMNEPADMPRDVVEKVRLTDGVADKLANTQARRLLAAAKQLLVGK